MTAATTAAMILCQTAHIARQLARDTGELRVVLAASTSPAAMHLTRASRALSAAAAELEEAAATCAARQERQEP